MNQRKQSFGFRANAKLAESIESYTEENNLSQSDALRELVEKGLRVDRMEKRQEELEERVEQLEAAQSRGLLSSIFG
jgi:hypothetical protein